MAHNVRVFDRFGYERLYVVDEPITIREFIKDLRRDELVPLPENSFVVFKNGSPVIEEDIIDSDIEVQWIKNYAIFRRFENHPVRRIEDENPIYLMRAYKFDDFSQDIIRFEHAMNQDSFVEYFEHLFVDGLNRLVEDGDSVAIGLSGGGDSLVVTHLINKYRDKLPSFRLIPITYVDGTDNDLQSAIEICQKFGLEHHIADASTTMSLFNINSSYEEIVPHLIRSESGNQAIFVGQYMIRLAVEKVGISLGANKIILGLEKEEFVSGIITSLCNGHPLIGLERRKTPHCDYIFPLANLSKKEIVLYSHIIETGMGIRRDHTPYSMAEEVAPHLRSLHFLVGDLVSDIFPGIEYHLYPGYESLVLSNRIFDWESCSNCHGAVLKGGVDEEGICHVCKIFVSLGFLEL